jgi:hypothetical protein
MSEVLKKSFSRRGAIGGVALAATAATAVPRLARAVGIDDNLNVLKTRYALRGGRVVEGYFLSPRGTTPLDTVVVLHGPSGLDDSVLALAQRHARAGKLVVVPDLPATYKGLSALAGRDAHVADITSLRAGFGRLARATGKVDFVAA